MLSFKTTLTAIFLSLLIFAYGCKKTVDVITTVDTPRSCFKTSIKQKNFSALIESTSVLLDSTVYFKNCSDSSSTITYKWDFGDGTTSDLKDPRHKYSEDGQFTVKLITSEKGLAFDTAKLQLRVAVGQKNLVSTGKINNTAIDIQENGNEFVLLGMKNDQAIFPYVYNYYISRLDRKLNIKTTNSFPVTTRFTAFCVADDGSLALTGNTSGSTLNNELIKIDANGAIVSSKAVGTLNNYVCISKAPDNGYYLLGTRMITVGFNQQSVNVLVKTDVGGNISWEKLFNTDIKISTSVNLVTENEGVVLAGVKKNAGTAPGCSYCDSVIIVKYTNNGNLNWANTVEWSVNQDNFFDTRIAKLKNGGYVVNNSNVRAAFFFSSTGAFADRKLLNSRVKALSVNTTGTITALLQESGNGFRATTAGLSSDGYLQWTAGLDHSITGPNGTWGCCFDSWPVAIRELKQGGSIVLANIVNSQLNYIYVPALLKLDDQGKQL